MNTLQISYFLSIVEHRTFSKASEENYVSQPTISKHIRNLEAELGTKLFDRTKTPIELTSIGEVYYKLFSDFISELERIQELGRKQHASFEGRIRIGILSGWKLPSILTDLLIEFQENHPQIQLIFENQNIRDMLALLNKGAIDTCLNLTDFVSTQSNISLAKLFDVPKYLVYSTKLIKKSTDSIVMTDFKNETFFCLGDASSDPTRPLMLEYCRHYHFCPAVKSLPNIESVMSNVEFGNGVTILDGLTQFNQSDQIRRLEMQPPHSLCLAWLNSCQNPLVPLLKKQLMTMGNFK